MLNCQNNWMQRFWRQIPDENWRFELSFFSESNMPITMITMMMVYIFIWCYTCIKVVYQVIKWEWGGKNEISPCINLNTGSAWKRLLVSSYEIKAREIQSSPEGICFLSRKKCKFFRLCVQLNHCTNDCDKSLTRDDWLSQSSLIGN